LEGGGGGGGGGATASSWLCCGRLRVFFKPKFVRKTADSRATFAYYSVETFGIKLWLFELSREATILRLRRHASCAKEQSNAPTAQ
jgi:hypothetical protein